MGNIISKKQEISKAFWLYFYLSGNGTEWIDYDLPPPSVHKLARKGYFAGWAIDGYFGTKKGREYINDVIGRFLITFADCNPQRLPHKPKLDDNSAKIHQKIYKLQEISRGLKSLPTKKYAPGRADKFEDHAFWAIKLYAEDLIAKSGIIIYETLEQWALGQFEHKERSTIRAKCRSVYNWYEERDFQLPSRGKYSTIQEWYKESKVTRSENMKKINEERVIKTKAKIVGAIQSIRFLQERVSVRNVAKHAGVSTYTARKYLQEMRENGELD